MLKALTKDARYEELIPILQREEKEMGGIIMCELLDKYENRGLERGRTEGITQGITQGIAQGMERVNELIRHLIGDGRIDEIERVVSDTEYQNELFAKYGI